MTRISIGNLVTLPFAFARDVKSLITAATGLASVDCSAYLIARTVGQAVLRSL